MLAVAETRRRYSWRVRFCDEVEANAAYPAYRDQLARLPRYPWFLRAELVTDGPDLLVAVAVIGRDRWRVSERQRIVIRSLVAACPASRDAGFSNPLIFPPPPHTRRGRAVAWKHRREGPEKEQGGGDDRAPAAV